MKKNQDGLRPALRATERGPLGLPFFKHSASTRNGISQEIIMIQNSTMAREIG